MKTMYYYVIIFALLFVAISASAADVSELPPAIQVRQYLLDLAEAGKKGDNAKIITLCEKMLAIKDAPVDSSIHYYYAASLAAVGREADAYQEVMAFLQSPNPDSELVDEALKLRKALQEPTPTRIPLLGISVIPLNALTRKSYNIEEKWGKTGVVVAQADPKGPGRLLQPGSVITEVAGKKISNIKSLEDAVREVFLAIKNAKGNVDKDEYFKTPFGAGIAIGGRGPGDVLLPGMLDINIKEVDFSSIN